MTKILDVCCGARQFWFDKENPIVTFMDNRQIETVLCDGRKFEVRPDIIADFRSMPFVDNEYDMVVFDPPHLLNAGETGWQTIKYGRLNNNWQQNITAGFRECFRVLKTGGFLIFKWCEEDIKVSDILKCTPVRPLFGNRCGKTNKTHWIVFVKESEAE